jgi:glutathione S-transferase
MGAIEPVNEAVKSFKGLHLYHTGRSNCSGRVRLLLEEKGLAWVSHYVDLYTRENISPEYFSINPRGVVPTLIDDGRVIVESNDILLYLEERFPAPCFLPGTEAERQAVRAWLRRSAEIHIPGVKTFAYAKLNAALVEKTPQEVALYRTLQKDPELLAFHAKHDSGSRISDEDVEDATGLLRAALAEMSVALARMGWLVGLDYSLADISWAPTITTLHRAGFPLEEFPVVMKWYERVSRRKAWALSMSLWQSPSKDYLAGAT